MRQLKKQYETCLWKIRKSWSIWWIMGESLPSFWLLAQGEFEDPCEVRIYGTCKNLRLIKLQFCPRPKSFIIGSFLQTSEKGSTPNVNKSKKKDCREKKIEINLTGKAERH